MNYLITLWLGLCLATTASAQEIWQPYVKGAKLVALSVNRHYESSEVNNFESSRSFTSLNAQFGYFFTDGFTAGVDMLGQIATEKSVDYGVTDKESIIASEFGFFAAYFIPLTSQHAIYPELRLFTVSTEFNGEFNDIVINETGRTVGVGITYFIHSSIGLDAKFRIGEMKSENNVKRDINQILFGFQIYL